MRIAVGVPVRVKKQQFDQQAGIQDVLVPAVVSEIHENYLVVAYGDGVREAVEFRHLLFVERRNIDATQPRDGDREG